MNVDGKWFRASPRPLLSVWSGATGGAAALVLSWGTAVLGQEYYVQNWHLDEGLPDGDITAIQQTPDGFLWVGTPKGLARFDGLQFKVFKADNTPGLTDSRISSLLTDDQGALWIGLLDGNLVRRRTQQFESVHPPLPDASKSEEEKKTGSWLWGRRIHLTEASREKGHPAKPNLPQVGTELIQDREGAIWWRVSGQGLMRLKAGQWTVFSTTNGLPGGEIEQLSCDREGRVWVEANGRLHRFRGDRWDSPDEAVRLGGRWPVLVPARPSGLWVADARGSWLQGSGQVRRLVDGQWNEGLPLLPRTPHANRSVVTCLLEDRTGRLWYGTPSGGLFFSDRAAQWQRLNAHGSVSQGYISCLFEDRQGNIWVGALGDGLYRIRPQPVTMLTLPPPLENFEINTVWAARDGTVWVGTGGAGVARWQEHGRLTVYGGAQGLDNPHVCALFEDSRTNVWAGTARGLFRLERERFVRVDGPPELDGWVKALFEDRAGRLWIGTVAGLISCEQGKFTVHPWPVDQPVDNDMRCDIRAIAEDAAGNLWVGTIAQGLFWRPRGQAEILRPVAEYPAPD
ncbi:MAG: hypothetical protein HY674_01730, partial [Chloroflexi bacterium]|nr:hypothetical protein [Chloroflexota bacterium]